MKKVTVRYTATFQATIEVKDDATPREIGEELANLNIPEDDLSKYVSDSFEPITDDDGDPKIYEGDGVKFF